MTNTLSTFVKQKDESVDDSMWLSTDKVNIVVAYTDKNKYIGLNNDLPWGRKLRGDGNFVNTIIKLVPNCALIMGRHTFESMPRKTGIVNIVLTRNPDYNSSGAVVLNNFGLAVDYCTEKGLCPIVFGGGLVYESALRRPFRVFFTRVEESDLTGDAQYPGHDDLIKSCYNISSKVRHLLSAKGKSGSWVFENDHFIENGYSYTFYVAEN
ncbi:dihydrofolate reductase [Pancytospora epiphaga]|nr:dihydrofolate reductase [Pancytospora epiphaga]